MIIKSIRLFIVMINLFLFLPPVLAAEVSAKVIGFSCHGCHGTDGLLVKPGMSKLKSRSFQELEQALLNFKYDKKPSTIMGRISKGYTDQELRAVALYFSTLK